MAEAGRARWRWKSLLAAAWLAWLPAQAAELLGEVAGPDARIRVQMGADAEGRSTWHPLREGREVLAPAPRGMVGEGADLSRGLQFAGAGAPQAVADHYELLLGKRRHNQYRANRRVFRWQDVQGHALAIAWQVSDDGAAFRYELERPVPGMDTWTRDAATFRLPVTTHAWLQPMAKPKTGFGCTDPSYEEYYLQDQLKTFQGTRHALFAWNAGGREGGHADFDRFDLVGPLADRSRNIPLGKVVILANVGDDSVAGVQALGLVAPVAADADAATTRPPASGYTTAGRVRWRWRQWTAAAS